MTDLTKPLAIQVQCYAGYRAEESPRSFNIGKRTIEVTEIIDQWLSPDYRYFKVLGSDNGIYILRHDVPTDSWELTMYESVSHAIDQLSS